MTLTTESVNIDIEPAGQSAVAWGAIVGGAFSAAAISLILMVLGAGFGLSVVSPWTAVGASAATIAVGSVVWLVVVQWIASGVGGYLTGRLRNRTAEPADEVFFRDTANGFIAWALSTLMVAAFLTSAVSAIFGTGAQVAAVVASGAAQGQAAGALADPAAYFVDTLYRQSAPPATVTGGSNAPAAQSTDAAAPTTDVAAPPMAATATSTAQPIADIADTRAEASRILANGLNAKEFPSADIDYLSQLVANRTGVSLDEAKTRVNGVIQQMQTAKTDAQTAADAARKSAAKLALYMFLSLIVGAFIAAAAAALGGGHRDDPATMIVR